MLAEYRITLPPRTVDTAEPPGKAALEEAQAREGLIQNMYARMVNSPGLLDTYLHGDAAFRQGSGFTPPEQEVVFLAISHEHHCEYGVAAHSLRADQQARLDPAVTNAIRANAPLPDPKLAALARFATVMVRSRGLPSRADVEAFLAAGFEERHLLDIILAVALKTMSTYANYLFHTPLDERFEPRRWAAPV